jgi:hypothetical protein
MDVPDRYKVTMPGQRDERFKFLYSAKTKAGELAAEHPGLVATVWQREQAIYTAQHVPGEQAALPLR